MKYLIDSDWVMSFLNGRAEAVALIVPILEEGIAISVVSYGEVLEGLLARSVGVRRLDDFEAFVGSVDLLSLDLAIARRYANVRAQLRAAGQIIPDNDIWIASTALVYGLALVSRDQHFDRIAGLERYPSQSR